MAARRGSAWAAAQLRADRRGLFALGNSSDVFLILRAQDLGVVAALIPILYLVFNLVYSGLSIPAGLLADRIGRRTWRVLGYLLFAAA